MVSKAVVIAAGVGSRLNGSSGDRPKPLVEIAGLSLLKRTIVSAKSAGVTDFVIVVGYRGEEIRREIESDPQLDVRMEWIENLEWKRGNGLSVLKARASVDGPFFLLMSDHLFDPQVLVKLQNRPLGKDEILLCVDPELDRVYDLDDATKVAVEGGKIVQIGKGLHSFNAIDTGIFLCSQSIFGALGRSVSMSDDSLSGGIRILAQKQKVSAVEVDGLFWLDVDTPESRRYAEQVLLEQLGKPSDGVVSRKFNRKISRQISRLLVKTPITPNQVSIGVLLISFLSAWMVSAGEYWLLALGGLTFQFASIVDGCDGEIAKLKFEGSLSGEWWDTVSDNISYIAFFVGVTYGMYQLSGQSSILTLGFVAIALNILSVSLVSIYLQSTGSGSIASFNLAFSGDVPKEKRGWFHRFCCSLKFACRRDFFAALFCLLAIANRLDAIYWIFTTGSILVTAGIFGYAGHMLRTKGVWPVAVGRQLEEEGLISEKAD